MSFSVQNHRYVVLFALAACLSLVGCAGGGGSSSKQTGPTASFTLAVSGATTVSSPGTLTVTAAAGGSVSVTLTSTSTPGSASISSYVWKSNGTQICTTASCTYAFSAGSNTVTLAVTDANGNTSSAQALVVVNTGPTASFTLAASGATTVSSPGTLTVTAAAGGSVSVTLTSTSTPGSASISSYVWKSNGTQICTTASCTYAFSAGSNTVTLTVTDANGNTSSAQALVVVNTLLASAAFSGTVLAGQQPVKNATVSAWLAGTSGYGSGATMLASTLTDNNGAFKFAANAYQCAPNAPTYLLASGGDPGNGTNGSLVMAAGFGPCSSESDVIVNINEVSTAVTAYSLSHFFNTMLGGDYTTDQIGGPSAVAGTYNAGLVAANSYTIPSLLTLSTGLVNGNTATLAIESAKLYSIANTLAACTRSTGQAGIHDTITPCGQLFENTTAPDGSRPYDTFQAAVQMAIYPYRNVLSLYSIGTASPVFTGLTAAPNDWTVGVSYTSPNYGLGINGSSNSSTSSNIDIDAGGRIWFPTNSTSAHGIAYFDPTSLSFNGPYVTTLTHPQYLTVTNHGNVFASDLSSPLIAGVIASNPTAAPTLSYSTIGTSGPITAADSANDTEQVLFLGGGTTSVPGAMLYLEAAGSISPLANFNFAPNSISYYSGNSLLFVEAATSGAGTACDFEVWDTNDGIQVATSAPSPCIAGGIANTTSNSSSVATNSSSTPLCDEYNPCFASPVPLSSPKSIAIDGDGNLWISNAGNASVSTLGYSYQTGTTSDYFETSSIAYLHGAGNGNTMVTPYGVAIDNSGNVWVSNAGCVSTNGSVCIPGSFVLSELIGAAAPTVTPLAAQTVNNSEGARPQLVQPSAPHQQFTRSKR